MTTFKINDSQTQWTLEHQGSDIGSLRFSPDGKLLAITCFNGYAYVRNASRSRIVGHYQVSTSNSPILSVRWNPKNNDQLLFSAANGAISSWSVKENKEIWCISEKENTVNSLDVSPSGATFCSVGSDNSVRVYDMTRHELAHNMKTTNYLKGAVTGHSNRVFATLYLDENTVASGGWDNTVILWDIRSGSVVRSFFGPSICGDGLCMVNNSKTLVTGSWRDKDQLQFFDIGTGNCEKSITVGTQPNSMYIYTVQSTPNQRFVACGGSGVNRISFFRVSDYAHLAQTDNQKSEIHDLDFTNRQFAFGLADSTVHVDSYSIF